MVHKGMEFYGLLDFFPNRFRIKRIYDSLPLEERIIYKMYVYSACFEDDYCKDLMWEFLNDWEESFPDLAREYTLKREKAEKRRKIEVYNTEENKQLE